MRACDYIMKLAETPGKLDKMEILREAWKAENYALFKGFQLAFDKRRVFYVKKVPETETPEPSYPLYRPDEFYDLLGHLESRMATGHTARDMIQHHADRCDPNMWNHFYRLILLKDMKCGLSETTVNKVLSEILDNPIADTLKTKVWKVQLATDSKNHPKLMAGVKMIDAKLDGMRLTAVLDIDRQTVTMHTRNGKVNTNFDEIINELREKVLPVLKESVVLDGEVVSDSFQHLMTMANRKRKVDTSNAHYALFDMLTLEEFESGGTDVGCWHRDGYMNDLITPLNLHRIYTIEKHVINLNSTYGPGEMQDFFNKCLAAGYEGIMVKDMHGPYECKRSRTWLKWKPTETFDLTITGFAVGKEGTKRDGLMGAMICTGEHKGKPLVVSVGSGFSDEQVTEFWNRQDELLGEIVEIKADCVSLADGAESYSLRFPRFIRFRSIGEGKI